VSDTVFLDPAGVAGVAEQLRGAGRAVTSGGVCAALGLPGDDAGLAAAVGEVLRVEGEAAGLLAAETQWFARRLDDVAAAAVQADHFAPR
jgi:hypothetical protein